MDEKSEKVAFTVAPGITISSTDTDLTEEKAGAWYREMLELIRKGEYEDRGVEESEGGGKVYLYRFHLSECPNFVFGSSEPIEQMDLPPDPEAVDT